MTVRTPSQNDIIAAANRLKILDRRLGRKHLDLCVCILRRRGGEKGRKLLERAGFNVREYERRPKSERRVRV